MVRDLADYGQRAVFVDMESAEVLSDHHPVSGSAGDPFLAWQYPLHSGKAFGWPGRLLIFVAGLAVCGLVAPGFLIWAKKWRGRRVLARHRRREVGEAVIEPVPEPG